MIQLNKDLGEGGIVLNDGNLEYAVGMKERRFSTTPLGYASCLLQSLIQGHPFLDGNKRTAITAVLTVLRGMGITLKPTAESGLEELALQIASGQKTNQTQIRKGLEKILDKTKVKV